MKKRFEIAVLPGDGIGPEVMAPTLDILRLVCSGFELGLTSFDAGAGHYERTGESIPDSVLDAARRSDAILLGAMGLPHIRYENGTEIAPQLELRELLHLYAGVRPIQTFEGVPLPLASPKASKLDLVLVRESTEGLFASRGSQDIDGDEVARDTMVVSRPTCEKLFDFAFELARQRKSRGLAGRVTCVDKANVLTSMAFFRRIFYERAERYPDITADCCYVDAVALKLVKQPWEFDVLVTENMFGDILSDMGAGLMGGLGMAPSADIGSEHAVFQPCHGSAPDIAGQGKANPVATFLSAALMLEWLGEKHQLPAMNHAADRIRTAIRAVFLRGDLLPFEFGGQAGTSEVAHAVARELDGS
ncbi:MAG TPA: isocitrate/isopropylmalate dehydrogenase family protein [Xanthomonadales bacterium]|nr:isocitrate/isopropylmalate dehydrogenase family protein [Xanthomonadales bacterium]